MSLYGRHEDIPALYEYEGKVDAASFNQVSVALKRLVGAGHAPTLRRRIPELKHLDLVLQDDAWIVIDRARNDSPIVCWSDFETTRDALHEPIPCRLRYYHAYAGMIVKRTLEAMKDVVGEELRELVGDDPKVLRFPSPAADDADGENMDPTRNES